MASLYDERVESLLDTELNSKFPKGGESLQISERPTDLPGAPAFPEHLEWSMVLNVPSAVKGGGSRDEPRRDPKNVAYQWNLVGQYPDLHLMTYISMTFPPLVAPPGYLICYKRYPGALPVSGIGAKIGNASVAKDLGPAAIIMFAQYEGDDLSESHLGNLPRYTTWQKSIPSFTTRAPLPIISSCQSSVPFFPYHGKTNEITVDLTVTHNALGFIRIRPEDSDTELTFDQILEIPDWKPELLIDGPNNLRSDIIRISEGERTKRIGEMREDRESRYVVPVLNYISMPSVEITGNEITVNIHTSNYGTLRSIFFICSRASELGDVGADEYRIIGATYSVSGNHALVECDQFELRSTSFNQHTYQQKNFGFCSISTSCSREQAGHEVYLSAAPSRCCTLTVRLDRQLLGGGAYYLHTLLQVKRDLIFKWIAALNTTSASLN